MAETTWQYKVQDYSPLFTYTASNGRSQYNNLDPQWNNTCPYQTLPNGQYYNKAICDLGSTHTTRVAGAGVSLSFYGNGITFYGNVSNGMGFDVSVDGTVSPGNPSGEILASVTGLNQATHSVTLTTKPSQNPDTLFLFDYAVVTVGTGLTGANVRRVLFQDSDQMFTYSPTPNSSTIHTYNDWHIPHDVYNTTWRTADTLTFSFSGNAVFIYGGSYSWYNTSTNQFTVGTQSTGLISLNSAMPKYISVAGGPNFLGNMYTSGLTYANTQLPSSNGNLLMFVDSNRDPGLQHMNLDFIEIVSVTGGHPISANAKHISTPTLAGVIVGPVVGVLLLISLACFLFKRRRASQIRHPLDLSEGYKGSVLDFTMPAGQIGDRNDLTDWQNSTEAAGSLMSGAAHQHSIWRPPSIRSVPTARGPETDISSSSGMESSSTQQIQELRREMDNLLQLVTQAPPPEYTQGPFSPDVPLTGKD